MRKDQQLEITKTETVNTDFGGQYIEITAYYPGKRATFAVMARTHKIALQKARETFSDELKKQQAYFAEQHETEDERYWRSANTNLRVWHIN